MILLECRAALRGDGCFFGKAFTVHERSLMVALLQQVAKLMEANGAERVKRIEVSVGEFSGVEAELLQTAFEDLVGESPACGAQLLLHRVPLEGVCRSCRQAARIERFRFECAACGGSVDVVRGEGLVLERVTIEQAGT